MMDLELLHPLFRTPGDKEPNAAYFLVRAGGEAALWAAEYTRPEPVELMAGLTRALTALRARRLAEGERELRAAEVLFQQAEGRAPDVLPILERWYHGALAYYHYCVEDHGAAWAALEAALAGIRRAIERRRFLLPFAEECFDLNAQKARVARARRRWTELRQGLAEVRAIGLGERPYCVLTDGTEIFLRDLEAFYRGLGPLTEEERKPLRLILDPASRQRRVKRLEGDVYTLPGFVIPYAPGPEAR